MNSADKAAALLALLPPLPEMPVLWGKDAGLRGALDDYLTEATAQAAAMRCRVFTPPPPPAPPPMPAGPVPLEALVALCPRPKLPPKPREPRPPRPKPPEVELPKLDLIPMTRDTLISVAIEQFIGFYGGHWKNPRHIQARLDHFSKFFPSSTLGSITRDDLNRWIKHLLLDANPNYVAQLMLTARRLYNWVAVDGLVNPFTLPSIIRPVKIHFEREPFTYEQYRRALEEAEKPRSSPYGYGGDTASYVAGALRIGFFTGLRLADVAHLAWVQSEFGNWVDLEQDKIVAHPAKLRRYRQRIEIPLDPELRAWLVAAAADKEHDVWVLPTMHLTMIDCANSASRAIRIVCQHAGLSQTFHCFRHGFVSRMLNASIHPIVVGQMTGQSIETIARYSHISMDTKRRAMQAVRNQDERRTPEVLKL